MAKHRLIWREGRATPQVVPSGSKAKKTAGGKVVKSRMANASEEKQIAKGQWVRTRPDGKGPNDPGAKRSSVRPQLAAKQKTRK